MADREPGEEFQVLSYFHFALAGLIIMLSLVPLLLMTAGRAVAPAADPSLVLTEGARATESITEILVGAFVLLGFAQAALVSLGARFLQRRERWPLCVTASAAACLFFPLGTVLGAFTLQRLFDPARRRLFH